MVLSLPQGPSENNGDMDWEGTTHSNKRPYQEVATPELEPAPSVTLPPASPIVIVEDEEDEPAEKYARPSVESEGPTQSLLHDLANANIAALPPTETNPAPEHEISERADAAQWVSTKVGATTMFYSEPLKLFKCTNCNFQKPTALSVATHFGRYCNPKSSQASVKQEEEDII